MNAEFRAYIDAITDGCCEEPRPSIAASIRAALRDAFAVIGDAIDDILKHTSPYHCDLHPWTRVRQTIRECCRQQAIGYHGLA
jgi:hypothetical protein